MHVNLILSLKISFSCDLLSPDPDSHWAGSRPAAKNWAEPLGALTPPGRPRRGPEPPLVPHHQVDAPLSQHHWAREAVNLLSRTKNAAFPVPQRGYSWLAWQTATPPPPTLQLTPCFCTAMELQHSVTTRRNNHNTSFLVFFPFIQDVLFRWNNCLLYL